MIDFLKDNWGAISGALLALWALAPIIAAATETKADDKVVGWINGMAKRFGLDLSKKNKKD